MSLALRNMNILDFENRVKQFASIENNGYINQAQLKKAFSDTQMFQDIYETESVEYKFFLSPFVASFPVGGIEFHQDLKLKKCLK